ncbi:MAG: M48 family metallopeptidase [Desulfobacteraceae bacterium]|jgi:STE24 endopeptidase
MHSLGIVILTFILLDVVINLAADILNLKGVSTRLPDAFKGLYASDQYEKSQNYLRDHTRFGWAEKYFNLCVFLVFWFCGGFAWLDNWVRGLGLTPLLNGLVFISVLLAAKSLLAAPFGAYATFVIEERFGFNQTTWKRFFKDRLKGAVLAVLLGLPLLAAILAFFQYAGTNAWWYCWIATTGFMLVVQYIAPIWIMPLFNRFDPLAEGALRQAIMEYAQSIRFALDNIFVMDGSKRSSKSNAFFTGFGKNRRIVLFDTLIEKHSVEELVAVLAHEMGHYKEKHILKNFAIAILQSGVMFYVLSLFISYPGLFKAFYVEEVSVYAGLIFFGMMYAPLDGVMGLALGALSRRHEFAADRFAVQTTGKPEAMIQALKKLSVHNLSNLQPHPFYVFLNYSHPPLLKRIEAIDKIGGRL